MKSFFLIFFFSISIIAATCFAVVEKLQFRYLRLVCISLIIVVLNDWLEERISHSS